MISFFRRLLGSKIGMFVALGVLAIIAVGFTMSDISGSGGGFSSFGGSGGKAAKIGGSSVSTAELQSRAQRVFEQERRANPGMQISSFLDQGGVEQVFDQLVAGTALQEFADDQGMSVSKRLVDAQIASIPAFHNASGTFSQDLFRQLLAREGISEKALREDIIREITARQLAAPAGFGVKLTDSLVLPYASLLLEAREGRIAALPAAAFAPTGTPGDAELRKFYADNADRFTVPEQRRFRYAVIDAERFTAAAAPTEAEIAAYFNQNKANYAARETRSFDRLVLPTEAAAKTLAAAVSGGKSMAAAAKDAGLSAGTLDGMTPQSLTRETSDALAKAAFAASADAVVGPVRTALGWQLLRVKSIDRTPAQTLDQAKPKIVEALRAQKLQQLLSDFTGKIENQVADGATFDEVAKDNGLTVATTPFLLSTGQSVQEASYTPPADVPPLLAPGFDMAQDDDAQLVPITADKRYALLDVSEIQAAAPPPLDKVKDLIIQAYKLNQGNTKAKAAAEQIRAKVAKGMQLDAAVAAAGVSLPPVQRAGGRRADVMRGDQRPPAELAILFSMAAGSVKSLPIGNDRGYFVVQLDKIAAGDAGKQPAVIDRVRGELARVTGAEFISQFERAIEKHLKVTRDAAAVAKVKQELRRANGAEQ